MKKLLTIFDAALLLSGFLVIASCSATRSASSSRQDGSDKSDITTLKTDEIVSDGYTETSKYTSTSATSRATLTSQDRVAFNSTADYICSKVTGVDRSANGGLIIRGISTIQSDTDPLVMIDGMEAFSVEEIRPSEIATIDVIKDGAAAIYGVRGANGVILITSIAAQHAKELDREHARQAKIAAKKAREAKRAARKENKQ